MSVFEDLGLSNTDSHANFIFFDAGRPQELVGLRDARSRIVIGRSFAPYANWIRITIGQPAENRIAQQRAFAHLFSKTQPLNQLGVDSTIVVRTQMFLPSITSG